MYELQCIVEGTVILCCFLHQYSTALNVQLFCYLYQPFLELNLLMYITWCANKKEYRTRVCYFELSTEMTDFSFRSCSTNCVVQTAWLSLSRPVVL